MKRITKLTSPGGYILDLTFEDGVRGTVDLSDLVGKGVFSVWRDAEAFEKVSIGDSGELLWESGVDLCADALYLEITGKKPEDLFPTLRREPAHA